MFLLALFILRVIDPWKCYICIPLIYYNINVLILLCIGMQYIDANLYIFSLRNQSFLCNCIVLTDFYVLADKFWYCRLSPNHKVLHYGDLEESPQGEVPHDNLQDKCK